MADLGATRWYTSELLNWKDDAETATHVNLDVGHPISVDELVRQSAWLPTPISGDALAVRRV